MSEAIKRGLLLILCLRTFAVRGAEANKPAPIESTRRLVCVGRVEPVDGEVEVCAQMSGALTAVFVKEGDWVTNGTVLAEVDARREKAALGLALAKLARVKAGNGKEEIGAAEAGRDAIAAELAFAESELQRAVKLREKQVVAGDELERKRQVTDALRKRMTSAEKQVEALQRGPLREDVALAEAEVASAQAAYELRLVRAESDGAILELQRHGGDFVAVSFPTPILRMANTRRLRVRLEINEQDVYRVKTGMKGEFTTFGADQSNGSIVVQTILPSFAPRRLFEPDSTARMDTRTLRALCELPAEAKVYSGQRLTATFSTGRPQDGKQGR
jgi:multidrug resistance efflux pump